MLEKVKNILLQFPCLIQRWKILKNRPTFGKIINEKCRWSFYDTQCIDVFHSYLMCHVAVETDVLSLCLCLHIVIMPMRTYLPLWCVIDLGPIYPTPCFTKMAQRQAQDCYIQITQSITTSIQDNRLQRD